MGDKNGKYTYVFLKELKNRTFYRDEYVYITDVEGMTEINNKKIKIINVNQDN